MKKSLLSFIIILPIMACSLLFLGGWTAPKSVSNAVNFDKLMTKWINSDNWVLEENETIYTINENCEIFKPEHIKPTKTVTERNGNITKRSSNVIGCEVVYIDIFEGDECIHYGYRYDGSIPEPNTSFMSPNPTKTKYTINQYFDNWIRNYTEPTIRRAATSIREENGVYYFEGFDNMSKILRDSVLDKPGDVCKSFSYKLTFGISKVEKPIDQIFESNKKSRAF